MTNFTAIMHKIQFRQGLSFWPATGSLQHSLRSCSWIDGKKWKGGRKKGGMRRGQEGEGTEDGEQAPPRYNCLLCRVLLV